MLTRFIPGSAVELLLTEAWNVVDDIIASSLIKSMQMPAPGFSWTLPIATTHIRGLQIHVWNSNNNLMTWFSLLDALSAIYDYMSCTVSGAAIITIYDGKTEIGRGMIS